MELTGKVIHTLPIQSGTGKKGEWRKQDIIVETPGEYPKKVCLTLWGAMVDDCPFIGSSITASINIESREYNGKWYTEAKAWKISETNAAPKSERITSADNVPQKEKPQEVDWKSGEANLDSDDLPFIITLLVSAFNLALL